MPAASTKAVTKKTAAVKPRSVNRNALVVDDDDEEDAPKPKVSKGAEDVIGDERVWIILEESKEIPPTGQFIGLNGRSWMIRPGVPVHVPKAIIGVLNDAEKHVPVMDADGQKIIEYRPAMRLPYRLLTDAEAARLTERQKSRV